MARVSKQIEFLVAFYALFKFPTPSGASWHPWGSNAPTLEQHGGAKARCHTSHTSYPLSVGLHSPLARSQLHEMALLSKGKHTCHKFSKIHPYARHILPEQAPQTPSNTPTPHNLSIQSPMSLQTSMLVGLQAILMPIYFVFLLLKKWARFLESNITNIT